MSCDLSSYFGDMILDNQYTIPTTMYANFLHVIIPSMKHLSLHVRMSFLVNENSQRHSHNGTSQVQIIR